MGIEMANNVGIYAKAIIDMFHGWNVIWCITAAWWWNIDVSYK